MILIISCRIQCLPLEPGQLLIMVVCPISALGFKSLTLAQLMARYATMDPTLISSISDKRKVLTLVAPPAAKRKRTTKKVPTVVRSLLS
jgi:hypothetical protein